MSEEHRNLTVDIQKGIGIFCVVAAHAGSPITGFVYLFHMPLFFMISGHLFHPQKTETAAGLRHFLFRRIRTLYLPLVVWNGLFAICHNLFLQWDIYTSNPGIFMYVPESLASLTYPLTAAEIGRIILRGFALQSGTQAGGTLWFLTTLFLVSTGYGVTWFVLRKLLSERGTICAQTVISIGFLILGYRASEFGWQHFGLERALSCYICFHAGRLTTYFPTEGTSCSAQFHAMAAFTTGFILWWLKELGNVWLSSNQFTNPAFLLLAMATGWIFVREIAWLIGRIPGLRDAVGLLGQHSLGIMVLHFLSFKPVNLLIARVKNMPLYTVAAFPTAVLSARWSLVYTVVGLCLPLGLSLLWKRGVLELRKRTARKTPVMSGR